MALMGSLIFSPSASVPMAKSCREHKYSSPHSSVLSSGAGAASLLSPHGDVGLGKPVPVPLCRACPQCPGSASCSPQPGAGGSSTGETQAVQSPLQWWQQPKVPVPPPQPQPPPAAGGPSGESCHRLLPGWAQQQPPRTTLFPPPRTLLSSFWYCGIFFSIWDRSLMVVCEGRGHGHSPLGTKGA